LKTAAGLVGLVLVLLLLLGLWAWTPDRSRAELEARYLESPGDLRDVAGVRLHLRDRGAKGAPALLLIHGFGASLHTWDAWVPALLRTHRVIRFDLPGSGLSSPDPTGRYDDARTLELLVALMDQLGLARASVIGHSIGGRMAWTFAATHPQRVDKLVLMAPDGFSSPGFAYGQAPKVPASVALMRYALPEPLLRMSLAPAYGDPSALTNERATRYHELMLAPGSRDALIARMQQTVLVDPVPLLKRIEAPTLLLWGERDAMVPFANAADYARHLPQSRVAALPGVGHLPQEEAEQASLAALLEFLD